ncbi:SH3 domain-containing protein [Streptomyces sp. NPDC005931]|uniref:SH3 domain-containing protein n=1 Tax=Streptomyces sp. NPDC005931 TaxID=3364737 RepID=UPI0036A30475
MAPRLPLTCRLPIALAAGALAVATAASPAVASDGWGGQGGGDPQSWSQQGGNGNQPGGDQQAGGNGNGDQQGAGGNGGWSQSGGSGGNGHDPSGGNGGQGEYKGVVTADRLALRSAPNRGSQVIRYAHKGDVVSIFCKVPGDDVHGNPLWYLLTDGTWAWGPARHIDNIGPAPRWC